MNFNNDEAFVSSKFSLVTKIREDLERCDKIKMKSTKTRDMAGDQRAVFVSLLNIVLAEKHFKSTIGKVNGCMHPSTPKSADPNLNKINASSTFSLKINCY